MTAPDVDALAALEMLRAALTKKGGAVTVNRIWAAYSADPPVCASTFTVYGHLFDGHIGPHFGERDALGISVEDVMAYRLKRKNEVGKISGRPIRPATRNREVTLLSGLLTWAARRRLIGFNPIWDAPDEPENNVRETVLSEEDLARILWRPDPLLRAFVLLTMDGGLRRGEAASIRWDQLDPDAMTVSISWRVAKTKEPRTTVLSDRAWEAINALPRLGPYVFWNGRIQSHFRADFFFKKWRYACDVAGVYGPEGSVTLHDLRRTFVTVARRRNVPETVIARLTGHRSLDVFRRYSIVGGEDIATARDRIEAGRRSEIERMGPIERVLGSRRKAPAPQRCSLCQTRGHNRRNCSRLAAATFDEGGDHEPG